MCLMVRNYKTIIFKNAHFYIFALVDPQRLVRSDNFHFDNTLKL